MTLYRVLLLTVFILFLSAAGTAYHGTEGTSSVEWTLTGQVAALYLFLPFVIISALAYSLSLPFLVKRYTGKSVLKPNPADMRKYAAAIGLTIGAVIAPLGFLTGITHYNMVLYTGFILASLLLTAYLNQDRLRQTIRL